MKISRYAFTLIELLVTITIIGMISSVALLVLKDVTEVKALSYTKKVMSSVESGIADVDSDGYIKGFVSDFGTMPPFAAFLLGDSDDGNFSFVDNELKKHRFTDMTKQDATNFPAPFMPDDSLLLGKINQVLFTGYHGGYLGNIKNPLNDGWQTNIKIKTDMNISDDNGDEFLTLISGGSDRRFSNEGTIPLLNEEFDFSQEDASIEKLYADDYNSTCRKNNFIIRSLDIDIKLDSNETNETAIIIYSPMLYYVDKAGDCVQKDTMQATCGGVPDDYVPYYPFDEGFDVSIVDRNVSWQIGLMKQVLHFKENNESRLYINQKAIEGSLAYDFNSGDSNLSDSIFFGNISVDINNTSYVSSTTKDDSNPFYIFAGTKVISIWYKKDDNWRKQESFIQDFKPNKKEKIKNYAGN